MIQYALDTPRRSRHTPGKEVRGKGDLSFMSERDFFGVLSRVYTKPTKRPSPSTPCCSLAAIELTSNTLPNERLIRVASRATHRGLRKSIGSRKLTRTPTNPAKIDVAVVVKRGELLTEFSQTGVRIRTAARLSKESLTVVVPQVFTQGLEDINVVGDAVPVRTAVVRVQVPVDVVDEVRGAAVQVRDAGQGSGGSVVDELRSICEIIAREEDALGSGPGFANGGYSGLDCFSPGFDVEVMRLVHDAKHDSTFVSVFGGDLRPE